MPSAVGKLACAHFGELSSFLNYSIQLFDLI